MPSNGMGWNFSKIGNIGLKTLTWHFISGCCHCLVRYVKQLWAKEKCLTDPNFITSIWESSWRPGTQEPVSLMTGSQQQCRRVCHTQLTQTGELSEDSFSELPQTPLRDECFTGPCKNSFFLFHLGKQHTGTMISKQQYLDTVWIVLVHLCRLLRSRMAAQH